MVIYSGSIRIGPCVDLLVVLVTVLTLVDAHLCPVYVQNQQSWTVSDAMKPGDTIDVVRPYFGDYQNSFVEMGGEVQRRMFTIWQGNEHGHFALDNDSGALKLNCSPREVTEHLLLLDLKCDVTLSSLSKYLLNTSLMIRQVACVKIKICLEKKNCTPTEKTTEEIEAEGVGDHDNDGDHENSFLGNVVWPAVTIILLLVSLVVNAVLAVVICQYYRKRKKHLKSIEMSLKANFDDYNFPALRTFVDRQASLHERLSAGSWDDRTGTETSQGRARRNRLQNDCEVESLTPPPRLPDQAITIGNKNAKLSKSADKLDATAEWVTEQRSITERKMSLNNALEESLMLEEGDCESQGNVTEKSSVTQCIADMFTISSKSNSNRCRTLAWTEETVEMTSKPIVIEGD